MGVRLNKVLTELNIGLQTAVDFLKKKSSLGEIRDDATTNTKITDEQYEALVREFSGDKAVKTQAEKLFTKMKEKKDKKPAEKHAAPAQEKSDDAAPARQQFKPLGKIDLDSLNKPKAKAAEPVVETKPEPEAPAEPEAPVVKEEKKVEAVKPAEPEVAEPVKPAEPEPVKEEPVKAPVEEVSNDAPEAKEAEAPKAKETPAETEPANDGPEIFTLKSEAKLAPKVNVLGKIDLSTLNQSTRPKKKTKEEKRKQREEKAAQMHGGANNGQTGEKRKRERIRGGKVDIEEAAKQQQQGQNQNKKNKNKGGNQNFQDNNNQQQGGKNKKNKNRQPVRPIEANEEDVARQVKETLARLTSKTSQNKKGAKYRKEKRDAVQERMSEEMAAEAAQSKVLKLTEFVTVSELATMMDVPVVKVIGTCMSVGIMVSINQRLNAETINLVAEEFGFTTEYVSAEVQEAITEEVDDENDLVSRAPIVTVMGHVDHGKTSLLDYIRNTNVIAGEAGGITQHIGAYNVTLKNGQSITFLDTPGHEAFTAMRARGAQVTDIAIIIVAADDSVMPTTKEAIAHAQAANVPMVFAINKIDKPGANPDKIREDLANMNLLVEEWGGKYQCQEISAKKGIGVYELLEKVLLEAEMLDLKANPNRKATGSIIESSLDKGRGYVSTVLVSNGTLKVGDVVIAGTAWGKVKAMFNERNQRIEKAGPAEPAIILGLNGAPTAGDSFHVMESEQEAREIANKRIQLQREQSLRTTTKLGLDELSHRIALGEFHELNIIVKGDTDGSIEALSDSFIKLSTEKVQVNVISKAVGQISENDVMLASASQAIIVGFQVRPSSEARRLAEREGVEINTYSIIYDAIDDVRSTMQGMLDKVKKEIVSGLIEVKQVFKISKVGTVAGGLVTEGKVHNKDKARVIRDGIVVHTAPIDALKRYKDDAKEVATGLECGISLVNFNDIQVGDMIETFTEIEVEQKL
ncbi:translation initiation factor IF-2 [Prevotella communis]|uniref:Translation initiation factor IF-2 n=1 Tax=Prevotella communis TaxID=2913614 RepID=A0A1H0D3T4_9BACT|nr:translation initiation factor IF-2 [Prevotella communis]SDG60956.1 translation initiation factor IF-2 [Prevotella communis]SDN64768.1 translation initiation factor IF-2 [Prevotella communis]